MATSKMFFKWFEHDKFTDITLVKESDTGATSVVWAGVLVGGVWNYVFVAGVGQMHIKFNCKGNSSLSKEHLFTQVAGTSVYKLEHKSNGAFEYDKINTALLIPMEAAKEES